MTSLVFELERMGKSPLVVFKNVEGHTMPVVTNVAGNRKLLALALGVAESDLSTAFRDRCTRYTPVELVDRPAWRDITIEADDVDLTKLPIPFHFDLDAAPYITAGQMTARDPETGVDTTGFHRLMLKDRNRLGVSLHSRRRMWEFHRRAEAMGNTCRPPLRSASTRCITWGQCVCLSPTRAKIRDHRGLFGEPIAWRSVALLISGTGGG
jgi:UbiD family decarboxylase